MKKNFLTLTIAAGVLTLLAISGCKKTEDAFDCIGAANKVSEASAAWGSNASKANCEAYADALQDYINSCPNEASSLEATLETQNKVCAELD